MKVGSHPFEEKLKSYVRKASPKTPPDIQELFVKEMVRAIKKWGMADPAERGPLLKRLQQRIEEKLGISPREVGVTIGFSKDQAGDADRAKESAAQYFSEFAERVKKYRARKSVPTRQLSFKIDGIDMAHPKLILVNCTMSGKFLQKSELRHGQGTTRIKGSPKPASVQFNFESFDEKGDTIRFATEMSM
jgi:hypothetical protein